MSGGAREGHLAPLRAAPTRSTVCRMAAEFSTRFPGESTEYRLARDQLLEAEVELRRAIERVAATPTAERVLH